MMVLTMPWHVLGQPRRISSTPYDSPLVEQWLPHGFTMIGGGMILVLSAVLFVLNLVISQVTGRQDDVSDDDWAEAVHPPLRVTSSMNGFALWNSIVAVWMVVAYGVAGAEPDRDRYPTLAGQVAAYTFKQLRDYRDGTRENRQMSQAVALLSDQELADLAAWYARQPLPRVEVDEEAKVGADTLQLVFRGDKTRLIQPCACCHGARGQGAIVDVPAIAGQNVKYFVRTLTDYARGKRGNDVYSRMRIIAKALTRDEIDELALYYARIDGEQDVADVGTKGAN